MFKKKINKNCDFNDEIVYLVFEDLVVYGLYKVCNLV